MNLARLRNLDRRIWILLGVILVALVAVFAWRGQSQAASKPVYETAKAARGTLSASVSATGAVHSGQSAVLQWQTSGRVDNVNAALGDKVTADEVLAALASSSVSRSIVLAESDLLTAQKNLDNLTQSNLGQAQAMQNLANAKQAVKNAQDKYDSLTRVRSSATLIDDLQDQIAQTQKQLKFNQWLYDKFYAHLYDGNPRKSQMLVNLTTIKQNLAVLSARLNWFTGHPSDYAVANAQAALDLAKAREADAQRTLDKYQNGINPDDLAAANARVTAAQATLNQGKIIAPFDGVITQAVPQPGDRIASGTVAFRVDDLTHLMIDLQISEMDINSVSLDQPVTITFDAIPGKTYNGVVSSVDQASDVKQGAVNFNVTVTMTDADELVKPGMSAAVTVTIKSLDNALLVPNRAVRMVNGAHIVFVLKGDQPVAVTIRLGAVTDTDSEVVGGDLKEGDLVILNPPSVANLNLSADVTPTPQK